MEWRSAPVAAAKREASQRADARLFLLEPRITSFRARIRAAAADVGLHVESIDGVEHLPRNPLLVGIGPGQDRPVQVAREINHLGGRGLLVFFTASSSARHDLQAELLRDPFAYAHYELIDLESSPRQLRAELRGLLMRMSAPRAHADAPVRGRRRRSIRGQQRAAANARGEQYLANVLAQANDAIFSTDARGRVVTWNRAAERLFGYAAKAAIGRALDLLDQVGATAGQISALAERVLETAEAVEVDACLRRADGCSVAARVSIAPVREAHGRVAGLSIVARDDSERVKVEEALRDAARQKDEFLAIMSHELRTPLTSILGYTDMLLRGLSGPLPDRAAKYVGNVRTAGDRLLELVNGLLDYTRLESGVERLELRPLDPVAAVEAVMKPFLAQAQEREIELSLEREPLGTIEADEEKLQHVVRSYLSNALKFTPDGGSVEVRVQREPETPEGVRVSVTDSGIGLRDEQVARVWDRFYQGDASLTRPYGGMGLGLSIARQLVVLHGGQVGAHSHGPGLGSTFWFSLPRRQAA